MNTRETELTKRELRCLKRVEARKSIPDFGALATLDTKGFVSLTGDDSSDMTLTITDKGRAALSKARAK